MALLAVHERDTIESAATKFRVDDVMGGMLKTAVIWFLLEINGKSDLVLYSSIRFAGTAMRSRWTIQVCE